MIDNNQGCGNCSNHQSHEAPTPTKRGELSRRKALTLLGGVLGAIGLLGAGEAAQAAAKTYVACKTSQVPVKGAYMAKVAGRSVLITQPKKGVFRAFDPTCTHQGCQLSGLNGTNLICTCHNGMFNVDSGAPTGGPVNVGLTKFKVAVSGTSVKITV